MTVKFILSPAGKNVVCGVQEHDTENRV